MPDFVAGPVTALPGRARRGGPACPPRRGQPRRVAPTKKLPGSHAAPPAFNRLLASMKIAFHLFLWSWCSVDGLERKE